VHHWSLTLIGTILRDSIDFNADIRVDDFTFLLSTRFGELLGTEDGDGVLCWRREGAIDGVEGSVDIP